METGVPVIDLPGVGDLPASIARRAGDGVNNVDGPPGKTGVGATMGERHGVGIECLCGEVGLIEGVAFCSPRSNWTDSSFPCSTTIDWGSSNPRMPCRSSYRIGENRTPTLAFLCPGSCAIGGRAKLARV